MDSIVSFNVASNLLILIAISSSEPKIAKAAPLIRGHALLVTRYFGYLGIHSIIDKKSSLSRERLVDFTGELQVKCQDECGETSTREKCPCLGESYVLPPWRPHYKIEPTVFGGRTVTPSENIDAAGKEFHHHHSSYAQELAPLPLENSVADGFGGGMSSHAGKFDGLLMHTSFCNELICQPKILNGCTKDSIVVKVEVRKLEWSNAFNSEVAVPVAPSIHNTRRGPWLVNEAFTSCTMDVTDPNFIDEFKVKLPLILGENIQEKLGLFFSVYHINVKTRQRRRASSILLRRDTSDGIDDIQHIGSGFLPLTLEDSSTCLIENGQYEVPITLRAVELCNINAGHHKKTPSFGSSLGRHIHIQSISRSDDGDDIESVMENAHDYPTGTLALSQLRSPSYQEQDDIDDSATAGSKDHASVSSIYTPPRRRHMPSASNPEELQTLSTKKTESFDESLDQKSKSKGLRNVSSHGNLQQLISQTMSMSPKNTSASSTDNEMVLHVSSLFPIAILFIA